MGDGGTAGLIEIIQRMLHHHANLASIDPPSFPVKLSKPVGDCASHSFVDFSLSTQTFFVFVSLQF
jgi:hypothetical protein